MPSCPSSAAGHAALGAEENWPVAKRMLQIDPKMRRAAATSGRCLVCGCMLLRHSWHMPSHVLRLQYQLLRWKTFEFALSKTPDSNRAIARNVAKATLLFSPARQNTAATNLFPSRWHIHSLNCLAHATILGSNSLCRATFCIMMGCVPMWALVISRTSLRRS
jgi:hypothetical protein